MALLELFRPQRSLTASPCGGRSRERSRRRSAASPKARDDQLAHAARARDCRPPTRSCSARRTRRGSTRAATSAVNASTVSLEPRIGRPSGCPSQKCCVKSSWTRSSGVSSTILISSRITFFSRSISSVANAGRMHDVRQQIDRKRQVLVEDLDVVAGVLLRRERVELAADRVDRLRDVLGRARVGALEEHVLDEVRDAALRVGLVPRAAHQPDADRHRPDVRHRLGDETKTGIEDLADDHGRWVIAAARLTRSAGVLLPSGRAPDRDRKCLNRKELAELAEKRMIPRARPAVQGPIEPKASDIRIVQLWIPTRARGRAMTTANRNQRRPSSSSTSSKRSSSDAGVPRFHGRQMFQWIYRRGVTDFERMTDLGRRAPRRALAHRFAIATPSCRPDASGRPTGRRSSCSRSADGQHIESVFIPDTPSQTFCLSTQVGCAMKCAFCLTARWASSAT